MGRHHPRAPAALFPGRMREHDPGPEAIGRRNGYASNLTLI